MNHKVFRSVFVLAVALGMLCVTARFKDDPGARPMMFRKDPADPTARPLACYQVTEKETPGGKEFKGSGYTATVAASGFRFGSAEFTVKMGSPVIEQGVLSLECSGGMFSPGEFGVGRIDRGAVIEEYLFEHRRVVQIYHIPTRMSEGSLRMRIPVETDLTGPA